MKMVVMMMMTKANLRWVPAMCQAQFEIFYMYILI